MRSQAHAPTQTQRKFTPPWSKHVFEVYGQNLDKSFQFSTMGEDSPPPTLTSEVRGREKSSKGDKNTTEVRKSVATSAPQKGGKKALVPKDSPSEGSSNLTVNAAALGSVIADAQFI